VFVIVARDCPALALAFPVDALDTTFVCATAVGGWP